MTQITWSDVTNKPFSNRFGAADLPWSVIRITCEEVRGVGEMLIAKELEGSRVTDGPHHTVRGIPSNVTIDVGWDDDPAWHTTCR